MSIKHLKLENEDRKYLEKKNKEEKEKRKIYRQNLKRAKKDMKDIVKYYGPWDYYIDLVLWAQIEHWIDYYSLGYNVWGQEIKDTPEFNEPDRPTRLEIALEMKRLYQEWKYFDYLKYDDAKEANTECQRKKQELYRYVCKYSEDMWD